MTANDEGSFDAWYERGALEETTRELALTRYAARTRDGAAADVWVFDELAQQITDRAAFGAALERVAAMRLEGVAPPLAWGFTADGRLHVAFPRDARVEPGSRSPVETARLAAPIARGLAMAHAAGLVHAGIRTDRFVQGTDGSARIVGLGVFDALCAGGVDPRDASAALGVAPYASPEQQGGAVATPCGDVYSLGASLYEIMTGKPPFGGRTTAYVMAAVLSEEDEDADATTDTPVGSMAQASGPATDAILRAIEQAPDDRWPSMDAFAAALGAVHTGAHPVVRSRRWGCLPGAAAAVLVIAIAIVVA